MKVALLATMLMAACGGGPSKPVAGHSPALSPSPSVSPAATTTPAATPTPRPPATPYGVLVGSQGSSTYTVSIIGVDGKVAASASASTPASPTCGSLAAAIVPLPVSTSNTRLYYMDAKGEVLDLFPDGKSTGTPIVALPAPTAARRSMFAVSPDDNYVAVVVADFSASGATTRLYMYELNTPGRQTLLFSQTGPTTLWPVGWHGTNNLVLAKVGSCTQGGGPFCCTPIELHVVDPATANRRFTLGGMSCHIAGAASPAGVACVDTGTFSKVSVLDWTGQTKRTFTVNQAFYVEVSPNGALVAAATNSGTQIIPSSLKPLADVIGCGWIDDQHVLSGGDGQNQPRIANVADGSEVPVPAQGDCGGRIPGGL